MRKIFKQLKNKFGGTLFAGTMWPGYAGTTTNVHIVLNTQKNTCQILLTRKNPSIIPIP